MRKAIHTLILISIARCLFAQPGANFEIQQRIEETERLLRVSQPFGKCKMVNPFIGTGGHGHTYPGATAPFGLVQLSPDTRIDGWDGCGGYHYTDSVVYGFSHTHLQGTGISDYGDILFTPSIGEHRKSVKWLDALAQGFSHQNELAIPGYYSVVLNESQIKVELTATQRTGVHRYTFPKGKDAQLFVNMAYRDDLKYYDLQTIGDTVLCGYRVSKGWADEQHTYFYAVFSQPIKGLDQLSEMTSEMIGNDRKDIIEMIQTFRLDFGNIEQLEIRVGISGTDVEGAKRNLYAESGHLSFEAVALKTKLLWSEKMEKAPFPEGINNPSNEMLTNYYTALYHCYTVPNVWNDVDGRFRGEDKKIHQSQSYNRYTVFSLWDTFRAYHPLMTVLEPEVTLDWIKTFLAIYEERGELPMWELAGNETYCMIGAHSISVILDAYANGIQNFNTELALKAMMDALNGPELEKKRFKEMGFVPADEFSESVSKTLEYCFNAYCIAQFEFLLNRNTESPIYKEYMTYAQNWKNIFDPETHFMRPRRNGGFIPSFDPYQVDFNFTEANAYQYALFVPHDIETLIQYHGGKDSFGQFLMGIFTAKAQTTGREQADITGLIGQYAHGNEPSHHYAYLFPYAGEQYEKAGRTFLKQIIEHLYSPQPDGLCGNEDCGQMSAWLVCAMNGIYKPAPGQGTKWTAFSPYRNIIRSQALDSVLTTVANPSRIMTTQIVPLPIIKGPALSFTQTAQIEILDAMNDVSIQVEILNKKGKVVKTFLYEAPFEITDACTIRAQAKSKGLSSAWSTAVFNKRDPKKSITQIAPYDNQYTGGGRDALIDGAFGGKDFRTGGWQGYYGIPLKVTVDLGDKSRLLKSIDLSVFQDIKTWIWYPKMVHFTAILDNGERINLGDVSCTDQQDVYGGMQRLIHCDVKDKMYIKAIEIEAETAFDVIPSWHLGQGGKSWIFADEIVIDYADDREK